MLKEVRIKADTRGEQFSALVMFGRKWKFALRLRIIPSRGVKLPRESLSYNGASPMRLASFLNECEKGVIHELIEHSIDIRIAEGHAGTIGSLNENVVLQSLVSL